MSTEASLLRRRAEGVSQQRDDAKEELDSLYALLDQPWRSSHPSDASKMDRKFVTFEGIGPTDEQTGVPIATRTVSTQQSSDTQKLLTRPNSLSTLKLNH